MRQTAESRREAVLDAAVAEFATGGLAGTATDAIARRAGISQPYLFRLFPTKKALFLAAVSRTFGRVVADFEAAAGERSGQDALDAMGVAYKGLLGDRTFLLVQLHAYAACGDADVCAATRRGLRDLWYTVERLSGLPADEIVSFFAYGMLLNSVAAMDLQAVDERWARLFCPPSDLLPAGAQAAAPSLHR